MEIAVRYYSRTGNTKRIADTIANELGITAKPIPEPLPKNVDLLFIGGAIYMAGIDGKLKDYIKTLTPDNVKKAVIFSTAAIKKSAYNSIKKCLETQGINVSSDEFHCSGKFTVFHKSRPNDEDLKAAAEFAKRQQ